MEVNNMATQGKKHMGGRKRYVKDEGLTSTSNFPGEIQQKSPVKPKLRISALAREQDIAKRIMKATAHK